MRRGLLAWNRDEVPKAVLDARVARLQAAMADAGLDCVLVYTSFPRPSGVSFLTHFVPYWSQGLLAVFRDGPPPLLVSLSKRVAGWVEETANIADVVCTPAIGRSAAALIAERAPGARRVGVVELAKLPGGIGHPLRDGLGSAALEDASRLFAAIRHPADEAEIMLSKRAEGLALAALAAVPEAGFATTGALIAALESQARLGGAEEVVITVAPDLAADARLRRMEGDAPLGTRHAVRLGVAYKGHWVRLTRSFSAEGEDEATASWIADAAPGIFAGGDPADALRAVAPAGFALAGLAAEACTGCAPLSPVAALPAGAVVSLTLTADGPDGPVLAGEPLLIGTNGPARLLSDSP